MEWKMEGKVNEDEEKEISVVRAEQVELDWQARAKHKQQFTCSALCFCLWIALSLTSAVKGVQLALVHVQYQGLNKHLALLTAQVQINLILHDNWLIW